MISNQARHKINNLTNITIQFTKRETISRYKGSYLGLAWSFITPLIMLVVYTFVFGQIFQSRWPTQTDNPFEFSLILFCGLCVFNIFSETITRAPQIIQNNVNYVKKVVFPLGVFPVIILSSALVNAAINFFLLLIFQLIITGTLQITFLFLPIVLLPMLLLILGLSWLLASLGVYLRDIGYVITIGVQALMLLSPIFYSVTSIPDEFKWFFNINPISYYVEEARAVVLFGEIPNLQSYFIHLTISIFLAIAGYWWFKKTKSGFSDVL